MAAVCVSFYMRVKRSRLRRHLIESGASGNEGFCNFGTFQERFVLAGHAPISFTVLKLYFGDQL